MPSDEYQDYLLLKLYRGHMAPCPVCDDMLFEAIIIEHLKEKHGLFKKPRPERSSNKAGKPAKGRK